MKVFGIDANLLISGLAFVCVIAGMYGIERKRSFGQVAMFIAQLFWCYSAVLTKNLFLGIQAIVLACYLVRIWIIWRRSERKKVDVEK
jgi:cbb3-type cytochrome oxidase subunit 3